jgi:hypothetical protein
LPEPICPNARLAALLAALGHDDPALAKPRCRPLDVADLEIVKPSPAGHVGALELGAGFLGSQDVDGDGRMDLVLLFTSVDYWSWFLFRREPGCTRFVGTVEGYQVELLPSKHHGMRDVMVWTYPLQGRAERLVFDGSAYKPKPAAR